MFIQSFSRYVATAILLCSATPVFSVPFDFNDGTSQDWTYTVTIPAIGYASPWYPTHWSDDNNYPNPLFSDPSDNNGSAYGWALNSAIGDEYARAVTIALRSPDLSADTQWQNL